jgi:signal transduction histidine kinase/FixJ family two-component response regulator
MTNKLLLVDDEEGIRKVLGISLTDLGYQVLTAENGEEALEIFRRENPPIVLTDIKMPVMDGIELLRKIKDESPDAEVIMITGHGDMDLAIKSLKYRAIDFVTKPINDDILEIALGRAHEKILMRQQLREYTENLEALVQEKSAQLVEVERQVAVGQAVEGLASMLRNLAGDLEGGLNYFNEMPCFVSIHNPKLEIIAVNQIYRDRLGDKVGSPSWEVYLGETGTRLKCPAAETFRTGTGQRTRTSIKYASGQEAPVIVHTAPIRNRSSDVELVVEISADIAEVKRLQDELRQTQQRYQQLFDEVPCYISLQDRQFRLLATNRQFNDDFDVELGAYCYEVYKHRDQPCPNCPVAKTFEDGQSHQSEMVVTPKSGDQRNVLIWTAPIRDGEGKIDRVMEMSTDITQIRDLQDHLSSLGLKIGSISHGIKSLLAGIDGGVYLVESGLARDDPDRVREGWDAVKIVIDRIRKLVLNILFFAKEREFKPQNTNVLNFAYDVAASIESKIRAAGAALDCDFSSDSGEVSMDAGVVRLALINILENALDACVEDTAKKSHKIEFSVKPVNQNIVFEIKDNGIGMNRETRENLFTLFFSSKGNKGTGLGLFIADKIITQHGGKINVTSQPNRGSSFKVTIPVKPAGGSMRPTR